MNKILLIVVFLLFSSFSFSQDGRSMKPIINDVNDVVSAVESRGAEVVKIEFSSNFLIYFIR